MIYSQVYCPIQKPVKLLTKAEVEICFEWFLSIIPERIDYLEKKSKISLNYAPESLTTVWDWFLSKAKTEKTTLDLLKYREKQMTDIPKVIRDDILAGQATQLSVKSKAILRDVCIYLGEVCIKNGRNIYWGYYTDKRDSFYNRPLLCGFVDKNYDPPFETSFDPFSILEGNPSKVLSSDYVGRPFNLFKIWERLM